MAALVSRSRRVSTDFRKRSILRTTSDVLLDLERPETGDRVRGAKDTNRRDVFEGKYVAQRLRSPLVSELARTGLVSRLGGVSFLGAIDFTPWARPVGAYLSSRLDHSLRVAWLAGLAADAMHVSSHHRNEALAAALLHDLGHGPLSHSLEAVFKDRFGLDHHTTAARLILGPGAKSIELRAALAKSGVDAQRVIDLMSGEDIEHPMAELFSGPINLDTIEGILRSANYRRGIKCVPEPARVVEAAVDVISGDSGPTSVSQLDAFWQFKGLMYSQFIRGPVGVLSDFKCVRFFQDSARKLTPEHFYWSDKELRSAFPDLFVWLGLDDGCIGGALGDRSTVAYVRRTFIVCDGVQRSTAKAFLRARYQQTKADASLTCTVLPAYANFNEGGELWRNRRSIVGASTAMTS